jgi:nicotinamidase-related amidase
MIDTDDSVLIMINYSPEFFEHSFSKMEFLMGMDYMNGFINKFGISTIFTQRKLNYHIENLDIKHLRERKEKNRKNNTVPESKYDKGFLEDFKGKISMKNIIKTEKEDVFYHSELEDRLKELGKNTLLFGGFFTDKDIFISAVNANIREFSSLVISDITSTYSERLYFQSLEMISQFVDVIDTRDLGEYFSI